MSRLDDLEKAIFSFTDSLAKLGIRFEKPMEIEVSAKTFEDLAQELSFRWSNLPCAIDVNFRRSNTIEVNTVVGAMRISGRAAYAKKRLELLRKEGEEIKKEIESLERL